MSNEELVERANGGPWWVLQLASKPEYLTKEGREWLVSVLPPIEYDAEESYVSGYGAAIDHLRKQAESLSKPEARLTDDHFSEGFTSGAAYVVDMLERYGDSDRWADDARDDFVASR